MNEAEKERLIKKNMLSIENRVRNVFNQGYEMGVKESRSKIPNTCGDAISRQAVLDIIAFEDKWLFDAKSHNKDTEIAFSSMKSKISEMPSVTPQQRTGRWIEVIDEIDSLGNKTWHHECSICGSDKSGWGTYKHCPDCGTKMEVSRCTKNI